MSGPRTLIDSFERRCSNCVMDWPHGTRRVAAGIALLILSVPGGSFNIGSNGKLIQMERCVSKQRAGRLQISTEVHVCKRVSLKPNGEPAIGATNSGANITERNSSLCIVSQKGGEKQDINYSESRSFVLKESKQDLSLLGNVRFFARRAIRRIKNG